MHRQRNVWVYLDLRAAQQSSPSDAEGEVSLLLRTLSYEQYLRTDH